jgi:phage baseplate assembly protein W
MAEQPTPPTEEVLDEAELLDNLTTEYDLLFPVVPPEDDPYPPSEGDVDDLISDIEEQQDPTEVEQTVEEVGGPAQLDEYRQDLAFNWTALEFFFAGNGEPLRIEGAEAIVGWANSALNTPKDRFAIYSPEFGCDLQDLLGQPLSDTVLFAEAARAVTNCLLQHPRITRVGIDSIFRQPGIADALIIDFSMYIDDDDEPIRLQHVT